jgi:hypothetical protein
LIQRRFSTRGLIFPASVQYQSSPSAPFDIGGSPDEPSGRGWRTRGVMD